jgi:hypothetical protein
MLKILEITEEDMIEMDIKRGHRRVTFYMYTYELSFKTFDLYYASLSKERLLRTKASLETNHLYLM